MTATLLAAGHPSRPAANTPTGLASAGPVGDDLTGARCRDLAPEVEVGKGSAYAKPGQPPTSTTSRDFFAACHIVTPPAPYQPAFGPWPHAHVTLAQTVARVAYTLEGA